MFTKSFKSVIAAATLVFAGFAGAATVSLSGSYNVSAGDPFNITTIASNRTPSGAVTNATYVPDYFYELAVGNFNALTTFTLAATKNETVPVRYILWEDANPNDNVANTGVKLYETVPYLDLLMNNSIPQSFQYTLQAGKDYVLQIQKNIAGWESISTNVSAVPLPGAIWMFGTALLGFLGFSSRRKV